MLKGETKITEKIIGIAIEIHKELGSGFNEKIYEEAFENDLKENKLKGVRQKVIRVKYKNKFLGNQRIDFMVEEKVIVELKAVDEIKLIHVAQLKSYLKTLNIEVCLILNFGREKLQIKRVIL